MLVIGRRRVGDGIRAVAALLVAATVAACGSSSSATPATIYITPPPATLAPGATPTAAPSAADISSTIISTSAPDGRWTVIFKKPVVGGISSDATSKINDAITAKVNGYISSFTSGSLPAVASGQGPSTLDGNFSIALNSQGIISLRFTILTYTSGAAHPNSAAASANFAASSGAAVALGDAFTNTSDAVKVLTDKAHSTLSASLGSDLNWPSSSIDVSFFEPAWAVTTAGLEFTWNQGQIGSSAAGAPSAVVSWADLKSVIKPDGPLAGFVG